MTTLRELMSDNGYESNEDYSYHVKCLLSNRSGDVRCLNVDGAPGRRKTAFANALASSLDYQHVLYHDFTQDEPVLQTRESVTVEDQAQADPPPAVLSFDRIMGDACAFSEADSTILILDQLQAAPFADHIRLYNFVREHEWHSASTQFYANISKLLIFLISEQALYHSLQKHSFRIWVDGATSGSKLHQAEDFHLQADAQPVIDALRDIFTQLGVMPTFSEFAHILSDIQLNVRTADELVHSIFGWTEGLSLEALRAHQLKGNLNTTMAAIEFFIGVDVVELSQANFSVPE